MSLPDILTARGLRGWHWDESKGLKWDAVEAGRAIPTEAEIATWEQQETSKTADDRALESLGRSRELRVMVRAVAALTNKTILEARAAVIAAIKQEV